MTISHLLAGRNKNSKAPSPLGRKRLLRWPLDRYFNELGSDKFLGLFLFKYTTIFCADGGTGTAPLKMISSAVTFLPYTLSLALLSGRTVEPASEIPANNPRARE